MGDATYQETFDEEYQVEVQEDDPEEMEGAEHPHKENTGGNQHHDSDNETGETADHSIKVNGHQEITSTSRTCDHLMIDLETMGKNPDAPIISIGAIFFDPQTGDMGPNLVRLSIWKLLAESLIGTPLNGGLSNHAKRNLPL